MAKMWAGRFRKELNSKVNDFNSSISFDHVMFESDIIGSIAHVNMLGNQNIISKEDSELIKKTLLDILEDIKSNKLEFDYEAEDIHMFIEAELTKRIGEVGKRLHTSRSRNDQVALDIRLHLRKEGNKIINLIKELIETIIKLAENNM